MAKGIWLPSHPYAFVKFLSLHRFLDGTALTFNKKGIKQDVIPA
ncbi:hypothetical protein AAEY33_25510 [Peribacillus simplex]